MAPEANGNSKVGEYKEAFQWLSMVGGERRVRGGSVGWGGIKQEI
jgi:hypothetical protein